MYEYAINDLVLMLTGLLTASNMLKFAKAPSDPVPDREWSEKLSVTLGGLYKLGSAIELDSSLLGQIVNLQQVTATDPCILPAMLVKDRLDSLIDGVQENLRSRKFMYVPRDQSSYWDNVELFGEEFLIGFPKAAILEMIEAGNCYAAGRWTACVFHSMRVAEHGLRRLARVLRAKISSKGKDCPLEYADWDTVITTIRNKIKELRQRPRGPKREQALQFFSTAADHCEYMKDIWRNEVSHTRRRYSKSESLAVLNRVAEFVKPLAKTEARKAIKKKFRAAKIQSLGQLVPLRSLLLEGESGTTVRERK